MMNTNFYFTDYDIYSKRIGLFFNKKEKIGSYFGLFLTISYIVLSLILFFILLIRTMQRKEIRVYDSTVFSQEMPIININSSSIYFAFGLENPNTSNRFVDETIYNSKIVFFDRTKVNGQFVTTYREELDFELCKVDNFGENYKHLFLEGELNNSYCLKNYNLTLVGGYKYNRMSYFRIRIYPCKNNTNNNNHCKPKEVIDEYFKSGYFSILTKDIGLNPSNYSFPVLSTLKDLYTSVDKQIYRDYIIYYGITEIRTDKGLFVEDVETKRFLDFRKESQSFNFREETEFYSGKAVCSVAFRLDDIIKIQQRNYTKLKDILSSTGGYMQLISTMFTIISLISKKIIPEIKIINGIFNFNIKHQKMTMKIHSMKDFYSLTFPKINNYIYFPKKNTFPHKKNNILNLNNLSKNSLIDNDNNSSNLIGLNNKENGGELKRESEQQNNITVENVKSKEKKMKKEQKSANIYTLFSKFRNSSKIIKGNNKYTFNDKISFNLFHYYCTKFAKKQKEINLFNLGIDFYKKRMDVINVFTFLLLTEKYIEFESQESFPYFEENK